MKQKVEELTLIISKFSQGEKNLNMILSTPCTFNKEGLGFNPSETKEVHKNPFTQVLFKNLFYAHFVAKRDIFLNFVILDSRQQTYTKSMD